MRIKTYEAPTMQEALALIKIELGEDAVVLNTKQVKAGGLLGLGGGTAVEVTAAIDEAPAAVATLEPQETIQEPSAAIPFATRLYSAPPAEASKDEEIGQLRAEVRELSMAVNRLIALNRERIESDLPLLMRFGVEEEIAYGPLADMVGIENAIELASALAVRMQAFAQPPTFTGRQVIALVGPTGVGKTTTLAKLAARFALEEGKSVALVTADTYRIGAVDQLSTYARIMGMPLEVAFSPDDIAEAVEKHSDKDVVLIDTVGRSQRCEDALRELKVFVSAAKPTDVHLVTSASLSSEIQREVVSSFSMFSPTKLIITKLDECAHRGCLINLPLLTGLGIFCTTAGQNVPQDLEFADAGRIASLAVEVA